MPTQMELSQDMQAWYEDRKRRQYWESQLIECPSCCMGHTAMIMSASRFYVYCAVCQLTPRMEGFENIEDAIKVWNERL